MSDRSDGVLRAALALAAAAGYAGLAGLVLWPEVAPVNANPQDLFIWFEAVRRLEVGQIPHVDFHSSLGALNFWGPHWAQNWLGVNPGRMLNAHGVGVGAVVVGACGWAALSRLPKLVAAIVMGFAALLALVPTLIDSTGSALTFAMHYNRLGWVALIAGLILLAAPYRDGVAARAGDALAVAALSLVMFYMKMTYFTALGLLWLLWMALAGERRWLIVKTGLICLAVVGVVEILNPGLHLGYVFNLLDSISVTNRAWEPAYRLNTHWDELALFGLGAGAGLLVARREARAGLYVALGFAAIASYAVIKENTQSATGLFGLVGGLALAARAGEGRGPLWARAVILAALIGLVAPETYHRLRALKHHLAAGLEARYDFAAPRNLARHIMAFEGHPNHLPREPAEAGGWTGRLLGALGGRVAMPESAYVAEIADGVALIEPALEGEGPGSMVALAFSNPFSSLLDLPPTEGGYLWLHAGRNFNHRLHLAPEQVFGGADYAIFRRPDADNRVSHALGEIYGDGLKASYRLIGDNRRWTLWRRAE